MSQPDGITTHFANDTKVLHHKGGIYTVIAHGSHHETGEWFVIYRCDRTGRVWIRSDWDFYAYVDPVTPRFKAAT